jgi:nucleoid-associated protein YgaU
MKNPLALFTGAALATLAALVGLNLTDWPRSTPDGQKPAEAAVETPKPEQKPAEEAGKTPETTEIAALPAPEQPKANTEGKVDLDTVRVESDGQTIVAGTAKPGDEIALKLGEKVIGKGVANSDGSWVVVPDQPLPKGGHEITIEQKTGEAAPVLAEKSIAVVVPEKVGQEAMVALTEPGTATKVLQAGGGEQQASLSETPPPEPAQPKAPETAEKPVEPTPQATPEQPKAEEPGATVQKSAESTEPAGTPAPDTTTVAKAEDLPEAVKPPESSPAKPDAEATAENVALGLDAVDYNDKGDIIFSGRARPGTAVRLYVDNRAVGDAFVNAQGKWSFAGKDIIVPGTHDLRVDQIDKTGRVVARIGLPFLRENAEAVAALIETPSKPEKTETPQSTEASKAEPASPAIEQTTQQKTTSETKVAVAQAETTSPAAEQKTTEAEPATEQPAQKPAEPQSQAAAEQPQPEATTKQPEASVPQPEQPAQTAEAQPPQASEVQKTAPEAEQPVAADKKEEVTTAAAVAAEQAAKTIDPTGPGTGKIVIQPGNNLWKLSRVIYGRGKNYTVIYKANKDVIRNPARIYPGQIFTIPGASPPEQIDPKRKDPLTNAEGGAAQ